MYAKKNVLVTGGTGLIGRSLVELLLQGGAKVRVASLDEESRCPQGAEFIRGNLMHWDFCQKVVKGMEYVFQLAGVSEVSVTVDNGLVSVSGEQLDRTQLADKLTALGYPEV